MSGFNLQVSNLTEANQIAQMVAQSDIVPKNYKNKPGDCLVAMMMGAELKLNPIQSLQNIAVINGRPCIWGDALLALVQNHPKFGGITESFDESTMTATCVVWRAGGEKHTQTFSQADAEKAKLWNKQGPWINYPKRMLAMRARGFALRNQFADALAGLITAEEAQDMPTEKDVTPVSEAPKAIEQQAWPQDKFEAQLEKAVPLIQSGQREAQAIIDTFESSGTLTQQQKDTILAIKPVA